MRPFKSYLFSFYPPHFKIALFKFNLLNLLAIVCVLSFFPVSSRRISPLKMIVNNQKLCTGAPTQPSDCNGRIFDKIIKPKVDDREYRGILLNNGLRVMLISDKTTDKSAAALDVNVGSMFDPIKLQGLAHFLEHLLFLGTEKYPNPDNYSEYISQHAGFNNAYTSSCHTNFFFDIDNNFLEPSLDRFAQFFITPLFDAKYTEKELNAVHSEYEQYLDSDSRRTHYVDKETCDQAHDYHKFNIGNKKTLKEIPEASNIDVRQELLNFHSNYYSANIMTLVVLGKESLDDLYTMVTKRLPFSEIKNKNITVKTYDRSPFGKEQLAKEIRIVPIKDIKELLIEFPIPDYHDKYYRTQPVHYVSHLIGHEGHGSILSELKAKGWVNSLFSYGKRIAVGVNMFGIKMDLTNSGVDQANEIVKIVFQYLNMMRKEGTKKWIFDECSTLKDITFDYKEKEKPRDYVSNLAINMHEYSIEEVVKSSFILDEYKPELIDELVNYLKPENMRLTLVAKKFQNQTDRKEQYYNIDYSYEDIPNETLSLWREAGFNERLHLPKPNEFIPEKLELVEREEPLKNPILYKKDGFSHVWYMQDDEYKLPKAFMGVHIKSPIILRDPVAISCMTLYSKLLTDSLNEYSYSANLAGIHYRVESSLNGLLLEVSGYSEKLPVILAKVVDELTKFDFERSRFDIIKELYYRKLKNFSGQPLSKILNYHYLYLAHEGTFSIDDYLETIDQVTFEEVQRTVKAFFSKVFFEIFVHGNVKKSDADMVEAMTKDRLIKAYNSTIALKSTLLPKRHLKLENDSFYIYHEKSNLHQNNAILSYYQFKMMDTVENVKVELLANIFSEKFFHNLRTEEQLGYIVYMQIKRYLGVQGIYFFIQSGYKPQYLDDRIENFLKWGVGYLGNLTDEEFKTYKESLRVLKCEKPKKLINKSHEYWSEIMLNYYNFDKRTVEVEALKNVTKQDIVDTFNEYFVQNKRKLSLRISGEKKSPEDDKPDKPDNEVPKHAKTIKNIAEFQSRLETFPILKPFINID